MIPKNIQNKNFRFIKIHRGMKKPVELDWTNNATNWDNKELQEWIKGGGNYGVATGFGRLAVIDADERKEYGSHTLEDHVEASLPKTFTVETGSGGKHYYYIIDDAEIEADLHPLGKKKFILEQLNKKEELTLKQIEEKDDKSKKVKHFGEVQWKKHQVVGPGSIHPDTNKPYKVIVDEPVATITLEQLYKTLREYVYVKKRKPKKTDYTGLNLPIEKLLGQFTDMVSCDGTEYYGSHPIHGSTTGMNFWINTELNVWTCFRHSTGGDTLMLIAMLEGLIDCGDCESGVLEGDLFKKAIILAQEKYGYKIDIKFKRPPVEPKTLEDVYEVFRKWLLIYDTDQIDLLLATALTNQKKGTPVWIVFIGDSGEGKSQLIRSLCLCNNTIVKDDITSHTLASGAKQGKTGKPVRDLGQDLAGKSTIILTPDMASLSSKEKNEKRQIWAKLRELFDGYINRDTGNEVVRDYEDCHVTWIFGATPSVRSEILIHAELGTRELLYELNLPKNLDNALLDKAWDNETYEEDMKKEIQTVVYHFIESHKYNENISIPENMKEFCKQEATRMERLRATAPTDKMSNEIISDVSIAKATRSSKQFKKLYFGFKSLKDNYKDKDIKRILTKIANSSGDPIRMKIMNYHEDNPDAFMTVTDYRKEFKIGYVSIKRQLSVLYNIGYLDLTIEERTNPHTQKVTNVEVYFKRRNKNDTSR